MSRPTTPQQFILDEETDFELTEVIRRSRSNSSSSNESLLLLPSEKPPPPPSVPSAPTNAQQQHRRHQGHFTISIPSRSQVFLAKQNPQLGRSRRPKHLKLLLIGLSSLLLFAWSSTEFLTFFTRFNGSPKIQVVLMISNGMGPASETLARSYLQYLNSTTNHDSGSNNSTTTTGKGSGSGKESEIWSGLMKNQIGKGGFIQTPLDSILVGTARTRSSNSLITDSSASSTAISCLLKTFNGGIAVTPSLTPCGTILESAHHQGFLTGLITNSNLTSSTPASFYSHTTNKDLQGEIAKFLIGGSDSPQGKIVDLALGGGKCWFVGNDTEGSCRKDQQDLLKDLDSEGIELIQGMKGLREWKDGGFSLDSTKKKKKKKSVLGFFSNDEMDYEVDRQRTEHLIDEQPSLKEMTLIGLNYLKQLSTSSQTKGFFLLIQNGKIDSASHENDPVSLLNEILSYFETVELVKNWVKQQNEVEGIKTVLISVSDYETGGLSLGRQLTETSPEYLWFPEVLQNSTHSTNYLGKLLTNRYPMTTRDWVVTEIYEKGLGIFDSEKWELDELWEFRTDSSKASRVLADAISRRAQIGWSTSGHTGVDVNLYVYGHNSTGLKGCVDNTEVGEFIAHTMGLNLDVVTLELNKNLKSWFDPTAGNVTNRSTSDLKHYEGEF
ncbi:hypothetical protein JCM3765_004891 [Sporobolomyces pararoseus]